MRVLPFCSSAFDGAFCVFGGFLGFRLSEAARILKATRRCMERGGFLVLEFPSPAFLAGLDGVQEWWVSRRSYLGEFPQVGLSENFYFKGRRAYVRRDFVVDLRDGSLEELAQSHRVYAPEEIDRLLARCGFSTRYVCGDWDEEPFDELSERLVVVADAKH